MVFPLYDDNPFKLPVPPYATWALIAINVLIFMLTIGSSEGVQAYITVSYAVTPVVVTHSVGWSDLTLVTGMFLHGGWEHLLGNMVYLWVFGDDIEEALGPFRFVLFYLLAGVGASIAYVALNPACSPRI